MVKIVETDQMDKRIDELLSEEPQRDPYKRFTILAYQLGGVGKSMRYSMVFPEQKQAHLDYMKSELADLLIQTIIMAKQFGFDVNELLQLGIARLDEYKLHGNYKEY